MTAWIEQHLRQTAEKVITMFQWKANNAIFKGEGIYHLTFTVLNRLPILGIVGGNEGQAWVKLSLIGYDISASIQHTGDHYPGVRLLAKQLMPDHIHIVLWVQADCAYSIKEISRGLRQAWRKIITAHLSGSVSGISDGISVNINRQILSADPYKQISQAQAQSLLSSPPFSTPFIRTLAHRGQLDAMIAYVHDNPRRALWRRLHPELFRVVQHARIGERDCALFGNLFLLRQPVKRVVVCHRWRMVSDGNGGETRDYNTPYETTDTFARQRNDLLQAAYEQGAVLVSGCISKGEQQIVADALAQHLPVILLQKEPITSPYWKPARSRFEACTDGLLLIIAPTIATQAGDYQGVDATTDYAIFHNLNLWAERIATEQLPCTIHRING